jgi:hypothetical protein
MGTTLQVSAPDPRYRGQRSCGSLHPSLLGVDTGDTREEEGGPAVASRGTCRYQCVVYFLLTPASPGEKLQGHDARGCSHSR